MWGNQWEKKISIKIKIAQPLTDVTHAVSYLDVSDTLTINATNKIRLWKCLLIAQHGAQLYTQTCQAQDSLTLCCCTNYFSQFSTGTFFSLHAQKHYQTLPQHLVKFSTKVCLICVMDDYRQSTKRSALVLKILSKIRVMLLLDASSPLLWWKLLAHVWLRTVVIL